MDPDGAGLTTAQRERAMGAVVGLAAGNALGNGYAFQPPPDPGDVTMRAGGLGHYAVGEWADDTAMAVPLLEALAAGQDLMDPAAQARVVERWVSWRASAKDVAPKIAKVLDAYDRALGAESLRRASSALHEASPSASPGNASLMRTAPLTLGYLDDPIGLAAVARSYSELTHHHPEAGDACVLLNAAQRTAILTGELDFAAGLAQLPADRMGRWEARITQAEVGIPEDFAIRNGRAVQTLQTAWSTIASVDADGPEHLQLALRRVIALGGDTATAAAITGSLLGARWGVSAIPLEWRRRIHGWPGLHDNDLVQLTWAALVGQSRPLACSGTAAATMRIPHPLDPGLWIGGTAGLRPLPPGVDAVVSLCPLGPEDAPLPAPAAGNHLSVWLVDSDDPAANPNLNFVVEQTLDLLLRLRDEGRTVYLHSEQGRSRAPFIAALYGARLNGQSAAQVLRDIQRVLPQATPIPPFERFLQRSD